MKKIFIVLAALFIISIGCKKTFDPGGGLCACSFAETYLSFIIKNNNGADLLDPSTSGYFSKDKGEIQLYSKNTNGDIKQINFTVRPPFNYGNTKFTFNQIYSSEIIQLAKIARNTFYLKLGNKAYDVSLKLNNYGVEKMLLDKVELPHEVSGTSIDYASSIFSLKL